jgi:hypothetical protein
MEKLVRPQNLPSTQAAGRPVEPLLVRPAAAIVAGLRLESSATAAQSIHHPIFTKDARSFLEDLRHRRSAKTTLFSLLGH